MSSRVNRARYVRHLWKDFFILCGGIVVSFLLVKLGIIALFLEATAGAQIIASFIAGIFFTSVFTIAPASVALVSVGQSFPALDVAFWGGMGGTLVDFLLFGFMRNDLARDAKGVLTPSMRRNILSLFHIGFMKWLIIILGGLIIASPLPDELGLTLLGLSKIKPHHFLLLVFIMNSFGIWVLVSVANAVL